ncbi:MAG TPA: polymer-forming cytoskeletal protein [Terriglobales bacterium]|nr:polymer-forming cytoskeletal protein [Terriglobales bacterium]
MEPVKPLDSRQVANIGKSVVIKGELSGSEDLYLDGEVEGNIELNGNSLTVGPNGRVRAHVNAREVVVNGHVDGNIGATERVELRKSAVLVGDIRTQRIMIEEGAYFKGSIDVQREGKAETKRESATLEPAGAAVSQK